MGNLRCKFYYYSKYSVVLSAQSEASITMLLYVMSVSEKMPAGEKKESGPGLDLDQPWPDPGGPSPVRSGSRSG